MMKRMKGCPAKKRCILYELASKSKKADYLVEIHGQGVPGFCDNVLRKEADKLCSLLEDQLVS